MLKWLQNTKNILDQLIATNSFKKVILTLSVGAVGVSIAANYFIQKRSTKIRILNQTRSFLQTIPELKSPNVRIKNPEHVEQVLSNFLRSGMQSLQVISDFDRTISMNSYQGKGCLTSNSVIEKSGFISPEIRQKFHELRDIYLPIEHDTKQSAEEKLPYMIDWWTKSFSLIVETQITRENLVEIVRNSPTHLKDGCHWFFNTLERHNVPLLIFSAGIGDVIEEWIAKDCGTFKNMKIVSNFMRFDESTNKVVGFDEKIIHILNKNESVLLDTEYEKLIENRPNVILLGDSSADVHMADGVKNLKSILKIGFLNTRIDQNLDLFMNIYDIVILKDSTFNVPNSILRSIC